MRLSALCVVALVHVAASRTISETNHPNVIIMHVNNLQWNDLGIHFNKDDNENETPNIDRLAYGGIILNRFYANGGKESLYSGCYQRSPYGNPHLMTTYFERNGYHVSAISIKNATTHDELKQKSIAAISHDNQPFFAAIDMGSLGSDIQLPLIDELVEAVVESASESAVLDNTIIIFLSLPSENEDSAASSPSLSPIESNYRRTAFIYSHLLSLPQSVANQLIHISDILPTLVNATDLKWRTRDRIYVDGVSQWTALNTNAEDARKAVHGENFYIEGSWKLSYGAARDVLYDSVRNQKLELSEGGSFDLRAYIESVKAADVDEHLEALTPEKVVLMRNRAKVHCNLHDIDGDTDSSFVINIQCTRASPCLFDLLSDPCELDDKHEHEYDVRRAHMRAAFERYLETGVTGLSVEVDHSHESTTHDVGIDPILTPSGGFDAFLTLMGMLFVLIFILVFITCIKERCNSRRSVYVDKSKKISFKDESGASFANGGVSTISSQVYKQQTRL